MPRISKTTSQALNLQDFTYESAMSLRSTLTNEEGKLKVSRDDAQSIVNLVRAWDTARDAVRISKGKPLPGSMKPEARVRRRQSPVNGRRGPVGPAAEALEPEVQVDNVQPAEQNGSAAAQ